MKNKQQLIVMLRNSCQRISFQNKSQSQHHGCRGTRLEILLNAIHEMLKQARDDINVACISYHIISYHIISYHLP